jgi:hypothetical protein
MVKSQSPINEDENLKRMLKAPPKPHAPVKGRKAKTAQDRKSNPKEKPA